MSLNLQNFFNMLNLMLGKTMNEYQSMWLHCKVQEHCQFGATLKETLCERFVTGVNKNAIQQKLLLETGLTLDKVVSQSESLLRPHDQHFTSLQKGELRVTDETKKIANLLAGREIMPNKCGFQVTIWVSHVSVKSSNASK